MYGRIRHVLVPMILLAVFFFFVTAISNLREDSSREEKRQLEEAIRRGVVTCYATEGVYPESFDYVKKKYGIRVDEERFLVIYDIFAENLMPEITVLERDYETKKY